ncbi:hypothetical protein V12B01_13220 [Vibrio splendidus 12B01]|nr:hypothetical protein V12B01_13220 [Vibrio splendidus 12B01]
MNKHSELQWCRPNAKNHDRSDKPCPQMVSAQQNSTCLCI